MRPIVRCVLFVSLCGVLAGHAVSARAASTQQYVNLGRCPLDSGETIENCTVGFHTFGELNADRSNIVLVPLWFGGHSANIGHLARPGGLFDTTHYFVVALDGFANGVGSSPSNSLTQPRMAFPQFSIADVARWHEVAVRQAFGVERVHAIVGISMGGMETFAWAANNPSFMSRAASILGTPSPSSSDLLLWNAASRLIQGSTAWQGGAYKGNPVVPGLAELLILSLTTPDYQNRWIRTSAVSTATHLVQLMGTQSMDLNDRLYQMNAVAHHDALRGKRMDTVAKTWRVPMLIVGNKQDRLVQAGPGQEFGRLIGARLLLQDSDCGHLAGIACESAPVKAAMAAFLE